LSGQIDSGMVNKVRAKPDKKGLSPRTALLLIFAYRFTD
jgi:hypothetical protein